MNIRSPLLRPWFARDGHFGRVTNLISDNIRLFTQTHCVKVLVECMVERWWSLVWVFLTLVLCSDRQMSVCMVNRHTQGSVLHRRARWPMSQSINHPSDKVDMLLYGWQCGTCTHWLGSALHCLSTGRLEWLPTTVSVWTWTHQHWRWSVYHP